MRQPATELRLFYLSRALPSGLPPGAQSYFPTLEVMFPSLQNVPAENPTLVSMEMVTDLSVSFVTTALLGGGSGGNGSSGSSGSSSGGKATVENQMNKKRRETSVWIRQVHLIEPIRVLEGESIIPQDGGLPAPRERWQQSLRKINDPMNEAYTDAVFACMASRLVETGKSPHFCRFYGTYNGRVPEYWYNCTDDMPDIEGEPWFAAGLRDGSLRIMAYDAYDETICAPVTRPFEDIQAKLDSLAGSITDSESSASSEIRELPDDADTASTISELVEAEPEIEAGGEKGEAGEAGDAGASRTPVVVQRQRVRLQRLSYESHVYPGQESVSGTSSDDGDVIYKVLMRNFPVQATILEKCDGTLDDLMEDEIEEGASADLRETKEARWTAWIFQIIAALTTAQATYDFVHNDLHTNNVMWVGTGETHLYYHVRGAPGGDRFYRVPTYGRIMKIIDFGRATFRAPAVGTQNRLWLPDAYAPGADAEGQYNCGAYFRQDEPKVLPNKSFDLCRLAVAILDTLWPFPEGTPVPTSPARVLTEKDRQLETVSPLWNMMWLWLTDKHGRNILRLPNGDERYPGFDLYCAIARDAANAVPAQQLTLPAFDSLFRCNRKHVPTDTTVYVLQAQGPVTQSKVHQKK
jgi:hypothetical protein